MKKYNRYGNRKKNFFFTQTNPNGSRTHALPDQGPRGAGAGAQTAAWDGGVLCEGFHPADGKQDDGTE
jgi:hypothetical protein